MKQIRSHIGYPVVILAVLIGVVLVQSFGQRQMGQAAQSELQQSIYWEPWAAPAGAVWCQSELDLQNPNVPFTYPIGHPPGDRELVNETVRRLIRTGATPQPWSEQSIQAFRILRTDCVQSWSELYSKLSSASRGKTAGLLNNPDNPTEADYRQAILRATYDEMGTTEAALEWFPAVEE